MRAKWFVKGPEPVVDGRYLTNLANCRRLVETIWWGVTATLLQVEFIPIVNRTARRLFT